MFEFAFSETNKNIENIHRTVCYFTIMQVNYSFNNVTCVFSDCANSE